MLSENNRKIVILSLLFFAILISLTMVGGALASQFTGDWNDAFNEENNSNWTVINTGENSSYLFQNERYELHTNSSTNSAVSLASYRNITNNNSVSQVRVQKINSSDNYLAYLLMRVNPTTMSGYTCGVSSDGTHFWLGKLTGGVYTNLPTTGTAVYNSSDFKFRCAVFGNKIMAKVWNSSSVEPANWQINSTDNSYTGGVSGIMLATYPTLNWSTVQVAFDDISVQNLSNSSVWVDDDWRGTANNVEIASGKIFGYNAFGNIYDALNNVSSGSLVYVANGTYNENITFNIGVTVIGESSINTTLNGIVFFNVNNSILKNFNLVPNGTGKGISNSDDCGIKVYASNVLIENNHIGSMTGVGSKSIKAIQIISTSSAVNYDNVTIKNNLVHDINQNSSKGSYGLLVQGNIKNIYIINNSFNSITSNGWSHAIEVSPATGTIIIPRNISILNNTIANITSVSGDTYAFSVDTLNSTVIQNASEIIFRYNHINLIPVRNLDPVEKFNALYNWWGSDDRCEIISGLSDNITFMPYYLDDSLTNLSESQFSLVEVNSSATKDNTDRCYWNYTIFPNIFEAIRAVAINGSVNITSGTYNEQVYINKSLILQGAGENTIIQPSNLTAYLTTPSVAGSTVCTGIIIVNNTDSVIIRNLRVNASSLPSNRTAWFNPSVNLMKFAGVFYYNTNGTIDNVISTGTNHITIDATGASTWGRQVQSFKIDANATKRVSVEIKNSKAENFLGEGISIGWNTNNILVRIRNNTLVGDGNLTTRRQNGIDVYYANVTTLSYNTIKDMVYRSGMNWATGIGIISVPFGAVIEYNNISNCDFGITDTFSSGAVIQNNQINGSNHTYGTGIYIDNSAANLTGIVVHANIIGSGFPYGGICLRGWYADTNTINETITDNILIGNNLSDGYGIFDDSGASGAINAEIYRNVISGWTKGISIEAGAPIRGFTLINNSIYNNLIYNLHNKDTEMINASYNWWGSPVKSKISSNITGNATYIPYYTNAIMTTLSIEESNFSENITLDNNHHWAVITNVTQNITITIKEGALNTSIDVSSLISNGTGAIPQIKVTSNIAEVLIPSTNITCTDPSWEGVIETPKVTTITLPETSGETKTLSTAIELGFDAKLSFDKAVRILFPNQKDKRVGYSRSGIAFTEITDICAEDSQIIGDALSTEGDCKISSGSDLIVWTKHFTTFAVFSSVSTSVTPASTGGTSCTYNPSYNWACSSWGECINGKQTRSCNKENNCGNSYGRPETEKTCEANISSPTQLFDIKMELEDALIQTSNDLTAITKFESFGTVPTPVDLRYRILDASGNEVYSEKGNVIVLTEQIITKNFEDLALPDGKYTLILTTIYGGDVTDEFRQNFEIAASRGITGNVIDVLGGVGKWYILVLLILIITFVIIRKLKNKRKHKH